MKRNVCLVMGNVPLETKAVTPWVWLVLLLFRWSRAVVVTDLRRPTLPPPAHAHRLLVCLTILPIFYQFSSVLPACDLIARLFRTRQDLCRIKWNPDPDQLPRNWFRGHIPDMIKCEMFDLWQADPEKNTAMVSNEQLSSS